MIKDKCRWVLAHQFFCQKIKNISDICVYLEVVLQKNKFTDLVRPIADEAANTYDCKVLSVSYRKERDGYVLRITIDGDKISLDTCANISLKISDWLDENESSVPYKNYNLEVSSPGPERPIKTKEDFERFIGKTVLIITKTKASDGRKRYLGKIKEVTDLLVKVYVEKESTEFTINLDNISKARLEYEFQEEK